MAIIRLLRPRRGVFQTVTLDNGSKFADHVAVAKAVIAAKYFCDPYCSRQRGASESTNGLVPQYCSKGTDFRQVTGIDLRKMVKKLNNRL